MRSILLVLVVVTFSGPAGAQQPSQVHLYCMNGQAEVRLTRQSEGRSVCLIRSFGHDSTARDWAQRNLPRELRCSCN